MAAPDQQAQVAVRSAIASLLTDFVARPFFDLRESDPQARLLLDVRDRIDPTEVPVRLAAKDGHNWHRYADPIRTSRAHAELRIDADWFDIAVLRGGTDVELTVYKPGTLDIVAPVRGEDLVAIVEVKAAPSRQEHPSFVDDLRKLARVTSRFPHCFGFFVLFDKSLHLGGATSKAEPRFDWLDVLVEDDAGRVEAHWVDANSEVKSRRGTVQD